MDMIGRLKEANGKHLIIEDPCYVNVRPRMSGQISLGMMRVTLLADKHEIELPVDKVLTYFTASEDIINYYKKVLRNYTSSYDRSFSRLLRENTDDEYFTNEDSEFFQDDEEETELIKTYMERMLQANNDIH